MPGIDISHDRSWNATVSSQAPTTLRLQGARAAIRMNFAIVLFESGSRLTDSTALPHSKANFDFFQFRIGCLG